MITFDEIFVYWFSHNSVINTYKPPSIIQIMNIHRIDLYDESTCSLVLPCHSEVFHSSSTFLIFF